MTRAPKKPQPPRCYASKSTRRIWLCCALPAGHDGDHKDGGQHWPQNVVVPEPVSESTASPTGERE